MAPEDIRALVAFVRSVPPIASPDPPATIGPAGSDVAQRTANRLPGNAFLGKKIFAEACASCRSWTGVSAI